MIFWENGFVDGPREDLTGFLLFEFQLLAPRWPHSPAFAFPPIRPVGSVEAPADRRKISRPLPTLLVTTHALDGR